MTNDVNNQYWIVDETKNDLRLFEVIRPNVSNGTDGTPQVRLTSFFDGWAKQYDKDDYQHLMTIESARELWNELTRKNSYSINWHPIHYSNIDWDEEHGTARIVK